jgi:hypothetical protein
MTIVKHETVELSENEKRAFDIVERILEGVGFDAEDPDIQHSAKMALIYIRSFKNYTEEIK